jgi:hypothetical protein
MRDHFAELRVVLSAFHACGAGLHKTSGEAGCRLFHIRLLPVQYALKIAGVFIEEPADLLFFFHHRCV